MDEWSAGILPLLIGILPLLIGILPVSRGERPEHNRLLDANIAA